MQDLCPESHKTLRKSKNDLNNGKIPHIHRLEDNYKNVLSQTDLKFTANPVNILVEFCV